MRARARARQRRTEAAPVGAVLLPRAEPSAGRRPDVAGHSPLGHDFGRITVDVLRDRVSSITGVDVGAVPVAHGNAPGRRAFTHHAQVTLGPGAGLHDVAHELAHAAQQRGPWGPWLNRGEAEHRADRIASAALSGEAASIAAGHAPDAAILAAGEPYSREAVTLTPPPEGASIQDLKDLLQKKIDNGDITGYSISGVKSGDPEEKYLYNALLLLADKRRWGSEMDLVTSIGSGKGMVTVRFSAKGKAEAELIGKSAPTVTAAFSKEKDAIDELVKKYKLAGVKGEKGKSWKIDELNKVLAAWGRLSASEAAALEGFTLIRTDKLELKGESIQGLTTHTDDVKPDETKATHTREIRIADSAFADDDRSFIGGASDAAPASFETLVHEVAHALEAKPFDDLNVTAADDAAKANQAAADAHKAQKAANAAINAARKASYAKKDLPAGQPLFDAVAAAQDAIKAFEAAPDDSTKEADAKKAIKDRDDIKAKIPAGNSVVAGLAKAIKAQDDYFAAVQALAAARATATASRKKADALKSGSNTKRLQNFVDFVTKESIPPVTAYAANHWPADPGEFFSEAFSLWKNDKTFFAKYSPKLQKWFDDGEHLK